MVWRRRGCGGSGLRARAGGAASGVRGPAAPPPPPTPPPLLSGADASRRKPGPRPSPGAGARPTARRPPAGAAAVGAAAASRPLGLLGRGCPLGWSADSRARSPPRRPRLRDWPFPGPSRRNTLPRLPSVCSEGRASPQGSAQPAPVHLGALPKPLQPLQPLPPLPLALLPLCHAGDREPTTERILQRWWWYPLLIDAVLHTESLLTVSSVPTYSEAKEGGRIIVEVEDKVAKIRNLKVSLKLCLFS
ncbi:uncharacterized protein LOC142843725 [Microtus pennsylvanicus]|uniref:uncharacterized protein LOC142843725 n=1 Tax=Microtus pennsylvanicus TaxID=10058 RepID=UPI003F6B0A6D